MRPPRGRIHSLTKSLDTKVLSLVRQYVLDNATADEPVLSLRLSAIYSTISTDPALVRQKKLNVEKAIERAIDIIREEDEEDAADEDFTGVDGWEDGEKPEMIVVEEKVQNAVNKRITEMWAAGGFGSVSESPSAIGSLKKEAPSPVVEPVGMADVVSVPTPGSPKRKRKDKGGEGRSKRQKAEKESRHPPKDAFLKDLGGIDGVIEQLLEFVAFPLVHPEVYEYTGVPIPRGVLLHGPPGCGKTFLANALAGELGLPFLSVSAPSIVSGMSGESEKKVRELFEEAREKAPCLMFIDEIDAITPKRESAQREMERRIVAQMLTCMDDLKPEKNDGKPVLIIGATNRPDSLDPALRRAGRFEKEICLTVPDEDAREKILRVLCSKLRLSGDFDYRTLAKKTPGFVGADLSALTAEAGRAAINRIFTTLKGPETTTNGTVGPDIIEVDPLPSNAEPLGSHDPSPNPPTSLIQHFLTSYPARLTDSQLSALSITNIDFLIAIPKIQPSSKREGFATVPDVTWSSIGALHSIREELHMSIVLPIQDPTLFSRAGLTKPTGVLLWGPPGCGKTLLAKAVANESSANFISVKGPELLNKYVGESERAVRQVFSRARASKPCIIFFDELDALVPKRDDALSEASARVVNTLLTELDGLEDRTGVFVVAATNRPDVIDPAMLRPGRLDKPLFVELPTESERIEIVKTLTKKTPLSLEPTELEDVMRDPRAECYSGADISALVREATTMGLRKAVQAGQGTEVQVGKREFELALEKVKPSVNREQRSQYRSLATKFGLGSGKS